MFLKNFLDSSRRKMVCCTEEKVTVREASLPSFTCWPTHLVIVIHSCSHCKPRTNTYRSLILCFLLRQTLLLEFAVSYQSLWIFINYLITLSSVICKKWTISILQICYADERRCQGFTFFYFSSLGIDQESLFMFHTLRMSPHVKINFLF